MRVCVCACVCAPFELVGGSGARVFGGGWHIYFVVRRDAEQHSGRVCVCMRAYVCTCAPFGLLDCVWVPGNRAFVFVFVAFVFVFVFVFVVMFVLVLVLMFVLCLCLCLCCSFHRSLCFHPSYHSDSASQQMRILRNLALTQVTAQVFL